jgi:ribosomal protein S11
MEDFVLWPGEKPGKSTTVPERIAWGFEGYRMAMADSYRKSLPKHYNAIVWQKSGAAYRFKQRQLLTKADAWIVGREHERSAFSHMILRTNVLMDGKLWPGEKRRSGRS